MKDKYIIYGDFQNHINTCYSKNKKNTITEAFNSFNAPKSVLEESISNQSQSWSDLSDDKFISSIYKSTLPVKFHLVHEIPLEMHETLFFLNSYDILVFKQFYNLYDQMHSHNFFESFYVYKGSCQLEFQNEIHTLSEGNFCIIAPGSLHRIIHNDELSTIITISIRKSTFDSSFFQLLANKSLLSSFFYNMLYNKSTSNYILFSTDNSEYLRLIIRNLMFEYIKGDIYSNTCCINWINILFSLVLRDYSENVQFYNYKFSTDFYSIINYIQNNYQNLTLKSLANFFNYNETYLSSLIKKNTGLGFINLITKLKLSDACKFLENTNISIEKISELTGYNSSDHFSKTFKKYYNISPKQYRSNFSSD